MYSPGYLQSVSHSFVTTPTIPTEFCEIICPTKIVKIGCYSNNEILSLPHEIQDIPNAIGTHALTYRCYDSD